MAHLKEFEVSSTSAWRWLGKRRLALAFMVLDALARDLGPEHVVHVTVDHSGGRSPSTGICVYVDEMNVDGAPRMPQTFAKEHSSRREAKADLLRQVVEFCRAVRTIFGVVRGPAVVG